jgi:hypothetical protein
MALSAMAALEQAFNSATEIPAPNMSNPIIFFIAGK